MSTVEEAYKERIAAVLVRFDERRQRGEVEASWTVPADAGGYDEFDTVVCSFCDVIGVNPDILPKKKRAQWSRVFRKIGKEWQVTPKILGYVIEQKPFSEVEWATWSNPHQAQSQIELLLGQHLNGGIKPSKKNSNQAIMAGWK